jgi:accessory gene regulator protein AgrB
MLYKNAIFSYIIWGMTGAANAYLALEKTAAGAHARTSINIVFLHISCD